MRKLAMHAQHKSGVKVIKEDSLAPYDGTMWVDASLHWAGMYSWEPYSVSLYGLPNGK